MLIQKIPKQTGDSSPNSASNPINAGECVFREAAHASTKSSLLSLVARDFKQAKSRNEECNPGRDSSTISISSHKFWRNSNMFDQ